MEINWNEIESKWRKKWNDSKDFETDPNDKPKKFITVAYPYPNSPQHIGHGRTYTIADIHARFYRMKGYNVLFPMGFHYTGTPILGMARRVQSNDKEIIDGLRNIYHVPEEAIKTFVEPIKIADYFHEEIKSGMIEMGYSIDWRREFTPIVPAYQKFIEWQINILKEKNLIIQGNHPVGWCPRDQNPVSQHDTMGDVEPSFTEYILIKFKFDDYIIPTATLRPETIFGVTNLWVNPGTMYKKITVDGEKWIVSKECARKLEFLDKDISFQGEIAGSDLVGKNVTIPHLNKSIPMLEASFVESATGTGLVMSVPAHAPFDYQALVDFKKDQPLGSEYQLIKPISIISTEEYGEFSAKEACEKFKIKNQDDPKLEEATDEVYGKEFYGGVLKDNCEQFAGKKVSEVKDGIKQWLEEKKYSDILLELTNAPVKCRCGAECVVRILTNQWFLNYGDKDWKDKATKCFDGMSILPNEIVDEFHYVVGWLHERACARQHGLGTKLPWDKDWIVESLSDSVIYMAYYTIARFVNDGTISAENLSKEFFDYVFLGEGSADKVSGIEASTVEEIRKEFAYFYPVDSRHSGRDLVPNHLTFFVFNHVAIFPEDNWPQQIVVNGSVLMDGKKMSKSMGNIIPLRQAIKDYGADPIRLAIIISAELLQDADFNLESVGGIKNKLASILEECSRLKPGQISNSEAEDRWIASRVQNLIANVTGSVEKMRLREALHEILFAFEGDLAWYLKRAKAKGRNDYDGILHQIQSTRVALLSPFAPHIAEEMWEKLGNPKMVSKTSWPEIDTGVIDAKAIQAEDLLKSIINDIANILKVTKITPKKITIYTADSFKCTAYHAILEQVMNEQTNMGVIMKELINNPETSDIKKNPDFVQKAIKDILSEPTEIRKTKLEVKDFDEKQFLSSELGSIIQQDFGVEVTVFAEDDSNIYDPKGKARHARPFKPAILIE
ncbi:leucine--tRNA ligase [Marine Group I thaumarchaeote]|uniref:Leucine--tRNA ligase n=1 Tax=Marine Group I thaumarchaeote TaxID=2511932 RepID=A0A7K4P2U5_9ARCH|nr:leucine--tRNA ligase [Marine Group I thaumarchaeote]